VLSNQWVRSVAFSSDGRRIVSARKKVGKGVGCTKGRC